MESALHLSISGGIFFEWVTEYFSFLHPDALPDAQPSNSVKALLKLVKFI